MRTPLGVAFIVLGAAVLAIPAGLLWARHQPTAGDAVSDILILAGAAVLGITSLVTGAGLLWLARRKAPPGPLA